MEYSINHVRTVLPTRYPSFPTDSLKFFSSESKTDLIFVSRSSTSFFSWQCTVQQGDFTEKYVFTLLNLKAQFTVTLYAVLPLTDLFSFGELLVHENCRKAYEQKADALWMKKSKKNDNVMAGSRRDEILIFHNSSSERYAMKW